MDGAVPILTLVKAKEIAERPSLSPPQQQLETTLTMLCSFLSVDDFISFLASRPFNEFARKEDPWVVFELGLYQDHTKTLQLIPSKASLIMLDSNHTGAFENHVWEGDADEAMGRALKHWICLLYTSPSPRDNR